MKKIIQIVSINIGILLALLVILEIALRLGGMETIMEVERKSQVGDIRYQSICRKISTGNLEFYNSFYTDSEGIFRANPDYHAKFGLLINADGFRGHPFENVKTARPKILLIGDSFVFGASAKPRTNSFADLLEAAGYYVYNAGIPGTDPQQYALIAGKYTARLKPDIVAVVITLSNDVTTRPLIVQPNKNLHYISNAGFMLGYDDNGHFFKDAGEAFEYLKKRKCGYNIGLVDYFILKTVIGRGISRAIAGENRSPKFDGTKKWVTDSVRQIQDTCDKNGTKCIVFLIPFVHADVQPDKSIANNLYLFKGFSYYYPENLEKSDYCEPPNNHLNNKGHRKYADFIINVLKQNGFNKK